MNNYIFYSVPLIFVPLYIKNLFVNAWIFIILTAIFFSKFPSAGALFLLFLFTDFSFYNAVIKGTDNDSD